MNEDLTPILDRWKYDADDNVQARLIRGRDSTAKVQLRVELGVLQMELHGRPDGTRPHEYESLLEFHRAQIRRQHRRQGTTDGYALTPEHCEELRRESLQYYHRRICLLDLGMYDLAERDAKRNLEVLDLLHEHAERREDWLQSEQYRPFIQSHRIMARALALANDGKLRQAVRQIDHGIEEIHEILREQGRDDPLETCDEVAFLQDLRKRMMRGKPGQIKDRLEQELEAAVASEDYEKAAQLRDKLRRIP